jgi:hypothetical protein
MKLTFPKELPLEIWVSGDCSSALDLFASMVDHYQESTSLSFSISGPNIDTFVEYLHHIQSTESLNIVSAEKLIRRGFHHRFNILIDILDRPRLIKEVRVLSSLCVL